MWGHRFGQPIFLQTGGCMYPARHLPQDRSCGPHPCDPALPRPGPALEQERALSSILTDPWPGTGQAAAWLCPRIMHINPRARTGMNNWDAGSQLEQADYPHAHDFWMFSLIVTRSTEKYHSHFTAEVVGCPGAWGLRPCSKEQPH